MDMVSTKEEITLEMLLFSLGFKTYALLYVAMRLLYVIVVTPSC